MALYKDRAHVTHSNDPLFDTKHSQGTKPANGGIYRCTDCGDEVLVATGTPLPRQHRDGKWQLLVLAQPIQRK